MPILYYLLTDSKFTSQYVDTNDIGTLFANNPDDEVEEGTVNYQALNPRNDISLDDLRALDLADDGGNPWLEFCIDGLQKKFDVYFDRQFGQRDDSEEEDIEEDEKFLEEIFSGDEDKENVKENAD